MPASPSLTDELVVRLTRGLVAYLKDLVKQARDTADDTTVWLEEYQEHVAPADAPELLRIRCPPAGRVAARYRQLEALARRSVELGDTHELVLGVGLLTAPGAGRRGVRRHLLTRPTELSVDVSTETVRLLPSLTDGFTVEDGDFLTAEDGFVPDPEVGARLASQVADLAPLGPQVGDWLAEWRRCC